jgi:hypothetical protein
MRRSSSSRRPEQPPSPTKLSAVSYTTSRDLTLISSRFRSLACGHHAAASGPRHRHNRRSGVRLEPTGRARTRHAGTHADVPEMFRRRLDRRGVVRTSCSATSAVRAPSGHEPSDLALGRGRRGHSLEPAPRSGPRVARPHGGPSESRYPTRGRTDLPTHTRDHAERSLHLRAHRRPARDDARRVAPPAHAREPRREGHIRRRPAATPGLPRSSPARRVAAGRPRGPRAPKTQVVTQIIRLASSGTAPTGQPSASWPGLRRCSTAADWRNSTGSAALRTQRSTGSPANLQEMSPPRSPSHDADQSHDDVSSPSSAGASATCGVSPGKARTSARCASEPGLNHSGSHRGLDRLP